jgi:hypothetical protein
MKVKKIPSLIIYNVLLVLTPLCFGGGLVLLIIFSNNPELLALCIVGSISMIMSVITTILAVIVRTLSITKGKAYCYASLYPISDYEPTRVEECFKAFEGCDGGGYGGCGACGIGFMIFFIDLISILLKN